MVQQLESPPAVAPVSTELIVTGMTCSNCVRQVTQALQQVPGVRNVNVSLETQRASVKWDANAKTDIQALVSSVKTAGYEAAPLDVSGVSAGAQLGLPLLRGWRVN